MPQCSLCLADSLFVSLFLLPLSGFSSLSFCLASRPSLRFSFFSSLFAPVTPSPCLLSLSLCVKRPAPLLFSSFLFLPLAPCLPAFLSGSVPHCPSLSPLCFSLSLSLSRPLFACRSLWFSSSLSVAVSLSLRLSLFLSLSFCSFVFALCVFLFCLSLSLLLSLALSLSLSLSLSPSLWFTLFVSGAGPFVSLFLSQFRV